MGRHIIALLLVPMQAPVAAVPIMPNLICYCSIATVACFRDIDFQPPPRCLGSLAGAIRHSKMVI